MTRTRARTKTGDIPEDVIQVLSEQEKRTIEHLTDAQIEDLEKSRLEKLPRNLHEIFDHSYQGASKAFLLAYGVRAGVSFCLHLLRIVRGNKPILIALKSSFTNGDARRFGSVIGGYTFLWKFITNILRIKRKKDDRYNSAIAGGIASVALLFEKKENRVAIAQQMFVRGLQALYNAGKARDYINFPNGDVFLFCITCAQVMYAYVMNPDSMPPAYTKFMLDTAMVPKESITVIRNHTRGASIKPDDITTALSHLNPSPHAVEVIHSLKSDEKLLPCEIIHPNIDSCITNSIERWFNVFRIWLPIYTSLHFIPTVILRMKAIIKNPQKMVLRTVIGSLRSSVFLSTFVFIYQATICLHRTLYYNLPGSRMIIPTSKYIYWWFGLLPGLSLFIEEKRRRSELAMYVSPKALESIWRIWKNHRVVPHIPYGEVLLAAMGMSTIMAFYQQEPETISTLLKRIMVRVMGTN